MNEVCLVYLARAKSGVEPFHKFLTSYRQYRGGLEHDILILFKGFNDEVEIQKWLETAKEFNPGKMSVSDHGFDLRAYGMAARQLDYTYFCFLNSFSEILAENWLAKMDAIIRRKGVGLVGATGSAESMYTNVLIQRDRRPKPSLLERLWTPFRLRFCQLCFDPWPNYHIRSNAFM